MSEVVRLVETGWDRDLAYANEAGPMPIPEPGQVVVQVEACGVCHRDLIDRGGRFPFQRTPIVPGHEAAGHVVAVGRDVRDWKIGDRVGTMHRDSCGECRACRAGETSLCVGAAWVFGILADGGYARHLVAPESALYALSNDFSGPEAAVLHCTFGTSYRDLVTIGHVTRGERVLITGASGGVGSAAVQIASRLGAEVVAVVRDPKRRAFVESLGAARVIVDDGTRFHADLAGTIDLALDTVGVSTFASALRSLRVGGRVVVVGNIVPEKVGLNLGYVITNGLTIAGGSGATRADMRALQELHRQQPFRVPIADALPLRRADEAQRRLRAGSIEGRLALVPDA
ncbi:MAG: alcohol dehydrogenase catalytic domain-containing protein [Polyangiales bacterium]